MKKLLILLCALCLALAGCTMQPLLQERKDQETVLNFILPRRQYRSTLKEIIHMFEHEHPDISINMQIIPDSQWMSLLKTKIAIHEIPDIAWLSRSQIRQLGSEHFEPMDASQAWYPRLKASQRQPRELDGTLYGMPIDSCKGSGLVVNVRLFERYHLEFPRTWEELIQVCRTFTIKGIQPLYASDQDAWTVHTAFAAAAAQVIAPDQWHAMADGILDPQSFEPLCQVMKDMKSLWQLTNDDRNQCTYDSAIRAMVNSKAAMYISDENFIRDVYAVSKDTELALIPLPYHGENLVLTGGTQQLAVFSASTNKEAAFEVLNWLSKPEIMDRYCSEWWGIPVYEDQRYELSEFQRQLEADYVQSGLIVQQVDNILEQTNMEQLWTWERSIINGRVDLEEGIRRWTEHLRNRDG